MPAIKLLKRVDVNSKESKTIQASFFDIDVPDFDARYRYELEEIEVSGNLPKESNAVYWYVSDFEDIAQLAEKGAGKKLYNRDMFQYALETMILNHDSTYGIGAYDVEEYLENMCKIEQATIIEGENK